MLPHKKEGLTTRARLDLRQYDCGGVLFYRSFVVTVPFRDCSQRSMPRLKLVPVVPVPGSDCHRAARAAH